MSKSALSIQHIEKQLRQLTVTWRDGHQSLFHYIWLRDNCACIECGNRYSGHRYLELNDIDDNITPRNILVDDEGKLQIEWNGDGHLTTYSANWLREHCYSSAAIDKRRHRPVLWDSKIENDIPEWDYEKIIEDDDSRLKLFQRINDYGFAIISNVPTQPDEIEQLASVFGFIRQTHYGRVFDLISTPQQRILAQTSHAIRPHNDENFRDPIPGLFMMHSLQASDCGGGASIFVDGFKAATTLRQQNQEYFDLLCNTPIPHRRFLVDEVDDVALSANWPVIQLDHHQDVVSIHINERTMAPLENEADLIEPVYQALKTMFKLAYAPEASVEYRLESGQAAILDNHRVLHARTAFNGNRHIRQCHVDRDEFFSRLRALRRRLDRLK
jgi:gamma-butyrobetaine dioxygenase